MNDIDMDRLINRLLNRLVNDAVLRVMRTRRDMNRQQLCDAAGTLSTAMRAVSKQAIDTLYDSADDPLAGYERAVGILAKAGIEALTPNP